MAKGMAAVIWVSMNPGAMALTVMFLSERVGARARTYPMTPAFDAA